MYTTTKREPGRKFGSSWVGKRFDDYTPGEQPGEENDNEHATSQDSGSSAEDAVKAHGKASSVTIHHDDNGKHSVDAIMEDGYKHSSEHDDPESAHQSAAQLSYEAGGEEQASSPKKRNHPGQQGAESEERNYEMPDLA